MCHSGAVVGPERHPYQHGYVFQMIGDEVQQDVCGGGLGGYKDNVPGVRIPTHQCVNVQVLRPPTHSYGRQLDGGSDQTLEFHEEVVEDI